MSHQMPFILCMLSTVALAGSLAAPACAGESDSTQPLSSSAPVSSSSNQAPKKIPTFSYRVVRTYPHDRRAFTQGLVFADGILYESTGGSRWSPALLGQSTLRKVELETGRVLDMKLVPAQYFSEGIAVIEERVIQLTWQARLGFVYDKSNLELLNQFNTSSEGWGLTHDGKRLIMSDGTSVLRFLDPATYAEMGHLEVKDNGNPVTWLNELEYVRGEILANVWQSERIARIDLETGVVMGWIDLSGILSVVERGPGVDVLNGIAYDAVGDRLFVTGKGWPKLFEIELIPPD